MFWADKIAKKIIDSGKYKPYLVDDMKTPSGRIHVGSLRGVVIHDLVYKALVDAKQKGEFTYVFDDHDPMDDLPKYLEKDKWSKYLGQPLFTIPSPNGEGENYAKYFADEFTQVFRSIGCRPKILWSSEFYKTGKMNEGIKICLDNAAKIRAIYEELYHKVLPKEWFPFQVLCPKCGKESTTNVTAWDGENVSFSCKIDKVPWTNGCGFVGVSSPFSSKGKFAGKLAWKVEWAVKWQVLGVTIEGAGKDHMSAGGSHDIAKLICERVINYQVPFPIPYEFFLIGGKKMSSSKGLGSSAREVSDILPPYLLRFLFTRTDYRQAIEFDPVSTMVIPDLFDEYDRAWQAYNNNSDEDLARTFELSQINEIPLKTKLFLPRFRDVANYIQLANIETTQKFEKLKGNKLTKEEKQILQERIKYAQIWIEKYAPQEYRWQMSLSLPIEAKKLTDKQQEFLKEVIKVIETQDNPEKLQLSLYQLSKTLNLPTKEAFASIYLTFLGKTYGPRAAWFLLQYPKDKVIKRLLEAGKTQSE